MVGCFLLPNTKRSEGEGFMKKKILSVVAVLLAVYIAFVAVDCIRLKNTFKEKAPLITIASSENENEISYKGLGYTVRYRKGLDENGNETEFVSGAEFWMFGKIILWGWIA